MPVNEFTAAENSEASAAVPHTSIGAPVLVPVGYSRLHNPQGLAPSSAVVRADPPHMH